MPALPDVPNVIRLDFTYSIGEDNAAKCRFFTRYSGTAPSDTDMAAVLTAVSAAYTAHLQSASTDAVILTQIDATDLTSPTAAAATLGTAIVGSNAETPVPASSCTLVSHTVSRRYRGGHPRVYWPFGGVQSMHDGQSWDADYIGAINTDIDAFMAAIKLITWTGATIADIVNVSFFEGFHTFTGPTGRVRNIPTVRVTPIVDIVTGFVARQGIASIRKRLLSFA
jgi:hypothetical protein